MKDVYKIALAGFLHDIGKFRQRTGRSISDELKSLYCPNYDFHYSHVHAAHTAEAIDEMELKIKKDDLKEIINLASSHHLINLNGEEKIIQIADRYASKLDRKESEDELKREDFIKIGLETPFSYVYLSNKPKTYYYKLQKLENDLEITDEKRCNSKEEYERLYKEFIEEIKSYKLNFENINNFLIFKSIFEKYTTFIPSSTYKTYPDVSLFDHSLATSAIAVAIKNGNEEEFSLIQGDFTSIQSFIFSKFGESNKYLAKILRAKSLFVNISTELIALKICKELNLTPFNIVMNAGGKFMILSHKLTKEDKNKIEEIKKWVNNQFKEINYLQTKFMIDSIDFNKDKFKLGEFAEVFKELAYKFEETKLMFKTDINVFSDYIEKAKNGICEVCGIVPLEKIPTKDEEKVCKYCKKFKEIGEKLPKAKYINFNLNNLLSISLSDKKEDEISLGLTSHPLKRIANVVPKFKEEDIDSLKYQDIKIDDEMEIKKGQIKTFYHIANDGLKIKNNKLIGRNYLAILKADIDNLGEIFIRGFNHEIKEATFSRVLYLSRMIDYFFTTILMDFIKDKNIYTVFAGGDDLFLIGHYEDIIKTYEWILRKLKDYTKNEDFHLSSAIHLTRPNVPLNLMAEFSEEELDKSKSIDKNKNAITVFGITMKNSEFSKMLEIRDFFEELYKDLREINSGVTFMYRFYDFIEMRKNLDKNFLQNARWKYMLKYLIEKNFEIKKSDDEKTKKIKEQIKNKLFKLDSMIEYCDEKLILPLNLFLYSIRERSLNV